MVENRVCILLAAYNGEKFICEQVKSILNQKNVCLDIFVSLDLSSDNSFGVISKLAEVHPNLFLLNYGEKFGSAGKNFFHLLSVVDFSEYDFIGFADQDDIWMPCKISSSINAINFNNAHAYSGNVLAFWEGGATKLINKSHPQTEYDYLFESSGPGCTFVLTRDLATKLQRFVCENKGLMCKVWLHDWFCYSFARSNGFIWYIDSQAFMHYRQHQSNEVGANAGLKAFYYRARKVLKSSVLELVVEQAAVLEQNCKPIKLIKNGDRLSLFKLALIGFKCRRKPLDKIFFIFVILFHTFKVSRVASKHRS